jgi:hypothetical protein
VGRLTAGSARSRSAYRNSLGSRLTTSRIMSRFAPRLAPVAPRAAERGIAQINHPNFFWQITAEDIARTDGATLMEIANMQPDVNSAGAGPDAPSAEDLWDQVLSSGKAIGVLLETMHMTSRRNGRRTPTGPSPSPAKDGSLSKPRT